MVYVDPSGLSAYGYILEKAMNSLCSTQAIDEVNQVGQNCNCTRKICLQESKTIRNTYSSTWDKYNTWYTWGDHHHGYLCYEWQYILYSELVKSGSNNFKCYSVKRVGRVSGAILKHNWIAVSVESNVTMSTKKKRGGAGVIWFDSWQLNLRVHIPDASGHYNRFLQNGVDGSYANFLLLSYLGKDSANEKYVRYADGFLFESSGSSTSKTYTYPHAFKKNIVK